MRRYTDPVEVRSASPDGTGAPSAFLWRGRLYVVRDVLGHWLERQSWWSSQAARMVHGEGAPVVDGALALDGALPGASAGQVRVTDLAQEREVWRVSASPGRAYPAGVYDLCREPAGEVSASRGSPGGVWHLVRIAD
jgi:Family of unknown function (DUF6504)